MGVDDVEVPHVELANPILRSEGRLAGFLGGAELGNRALHGQPLGLVGQVRALGIQDGVVVPPAQREGHAPGHNVRDPLLQALADHQGLRIEPAPLVEESAELAAHGEVVVESVLVVDARQEAFVGDVQEGHPRRLVDAPALGLDDAVFDLIGHPQPVAPPNTVGLEHQLDGFELLAVDGDREALGEGNRHLFRLYRDGLVPELDAHNRRDDVRAGVQKLQVLRLVGRPPDIGVGGIGLFGRHFVAVAARLEPGADLGPAAQLPHEFLVEPGLIDPEAGIGQEAVAVETFDIVALVGGTVAPDADPVLVHSPHQEGPGDRPAEGGGVEVLFAAGDDVEGAAHQRAKPFGDELLPAVNQARLHRAVLPGLLGNTFQVGLIRLAEIGGVGVGQRAFFLHPGDGDRGIEPAGEGQTDLFVLGE